MKKIIKFYLDGFFFLTLIVLSMVFTVVSLFLSNKVFGIAVIFDASVILLIFITVIIYSVIDEFKSSDDPLDETENTNPQDNVQPNKEEPETKSGKVFIVYNESDLKHLIDHEVSKQLDQRIAEINNHKK